MCYCQPGKISLVLRDVVGAQKIKLKRFWYNFSIISKENDSIPLDTAVKGPSNLKVQVASAKFVISTSSTSLGTLSEINELSSPGN
jgi:hypothetical protein